MTLRVAFDLDGVLADLDSELARQAEVLFGQRVLRRSSAPQEAPSASEPAASTPKEAPSASDLPSPSVPQDEVPPDLQLELTARQQRRLWRHIAAIEDFWESLQETEPGIVARLATLATAHRWEVIFLTKRPRTAGVTAQLQSQRWLSTKGFVFPSVYVVQGSRGRIAAALGLDVVIDDRPENCLDVVADSKARAVLVWREDEKLLPAATRRLGIGVVQSVDEILSILSRPDETDSERSGIVERVKRFLKGKQPAGA